MNPNRKPARDATIALLYRKNFDFIDLDVDKITGIQLPAGKDINYDFFIAYLSSLDK